MSVTVLVLLGREATENPSFNLFPGARGSTPPH